MCGIGDFGCYFNDILTTTGLNTIINALLSILSFVTGLFDKLLVIGNLIINMLLYFMTFLEIVGAVILNPFLLALVVMGTGFYFASYKAQTRKDLLIELGNYYKYVFEIATKLMHALYTIVVRIVVALIDIF